MQETLLESLAALEGCYISSLPWKQNQVLRRLRKVPREKYSLEEWSYCLGYIFREKVRLADYEALERFLVQAGDKPAKN